MPRPTFSANPASSVAEQIPNVRAVALVSYPCGMAASVLLSNHFPLAAQITKPLLWVTGDGDQFHSVQQSKVAENYLNVLRLRACVDCLVRWWSCLCTSVHTTWKRGDNNPVERTPFEQSSWGEI